MWALVNILPFQHFFVVRYNTFGSFVKKHNILVLFMQDDNTLVKIIQKLLVAFVNALCMNENEAHFSDDYVHYGEVECHLYKAHNQLHHVDGFIMESRLACEVYERRY